MSTHTIRLASPEDAAGMLTIYGPIIEETVISFEMEVPSVSEFGDRIKKYLDTRPWLVYETDGIIAGYAYAGPHRARAAYQWTTEVSVYIHTDFRQQGIAKALYQKLLPVLSLQGYRTALAGVTQPNEASVKFHESFGFRPLGLYHRVGYKFGTWHDVGWWELDLNPGLKVVNPPLSLEETMGSTAWETIFSAQ